MFAADRKMIRYRSRKPPKQSSVERFNGKIRHALLTETLFLSIKQGLEAVAEWIEDHNTHRPHSSLAFDTPLAYAAKFTATGWHTTGQGSKNCWMKVQR